MCVSTKATTNSRSLSVDDINLVYLWFHFRDFFLFWIYILGNNCQIMSEMGDIIEFTSSILIRYFRIL